MQRVISAIQLCKAFISSFLPRIGPNGEDLGTEEDAKKISDAKHKRRGSNSSVTHVNTVIHKPQKEFDDEMRYGVWKHRTS